MVATKPMTAEELEVPPEVECRWELVRGELVRRPYKVWKGAALTGTIASSMWQFVEGRELEFAGFGCGIVLKRDPDTVPAPQVAFIRAEMIPRGAAAEQVVRGGADLAVEIVPPSGSLDKLLAKADE